MVDLRVVAKDTGLCALWLGAGSCSNGQGQERPASSLKRATYRHICHSKKRCAKCHGRDLDPASGPLPLCSYEPSGALASQENCVSRETPNIEKRNK